MDQEKQENRIELVLTQEDKAVLLLALKHLHNSTVGDISEKSNLLLQRLQSDS